LRTLADTPTMRSTFAGPIQVFTYTEQEGWSDIALADDVAKTNVTAILRQHGLENVRSL
jgi:hypothetical protein